MDTLVALTAFQESEQKPEPRDKLRTTHLNNALSYPPRDSRLVIVQDFIPQHVGVRTFGARYKNGQWYDSANNYTIALTDKAIWFDSMLTDRWCRAF